MTRSGTATGTAPVDAYVAQLGAALSGPRRRKADLLTEARDGLIDATEALEADGLRRLEAERRAVEDFGELSEVVPGYRAELGFSQGRRAATALTLVLLAQPIIWREGMWAWNQADVLVPGSTEYKLQQLIELVGTVAIVGGVLAVIACGIGVRVPAIRARAAKATAVFTLLSCALVGAVSISLGVTSPTATGLGGLGWVSLFVLGPLSFVGYSAGRCLRLA